MKLRFATENDAKILLEIYKHYIDTTITFEYELPTILEFQKRIREFGSVYPYFVCEENDVCIGYVYAHRAQERAAYQWNVELSIYLSPTYGKKGIGRRLYQVMEELLKLQGVKNLYGLVTTPNLPSERLHFQSGFQLSGRYHNTGYKDGKWCDVLLFEKQIGTFDAKPHPVIPVQKLDQAIVKEIGNRNGFVVEL